jgi:hypothetical protein
VHNFWWTHTVAWADLGGATVAPGGARGADTIWILALRRGSFLRIRTPIRRGSGYVFNLYDRSLRGPKEQGSLAHRAVAPWEFDVILQLLRDGTQADTEFLDERRSWSRHAKQHARTIRELVAIACAGGSVRPACRIGATAGSVEAASEVVDAGALALVLSGSSAPGASSHPRDGGGIEPQGRPRPGSGRGAGLVSVVGQALGAGRERRPGDNLSPRTSRERLFGQPERCSSTLRLSGCTDCSLQPDALESHTDCKPQSDCLVAEEGT